MSDDATVVASGLLREARSRRGMTQRELATAAGVPQSLIAKIESGTRQPTLPTLMRLIEAAGFTVQAALANRTRPSMLLRSRRGELRALAAHHGIDRVRVFGSVARGEDRPDSDLDLLVDLAPHRDPLGHLAFDGAAEALLGCPVDVVTARSLSSTLRATVLGEARDLDEI